MENLIEKYPYLKYLERPLDNQQLKVCCRTDNTVVAAGAGSGKTQVLATRFAWLVMEHDDISASSILTLTFTKKAAAEMYSRIYDTLKHFAYECGENIPERQRKNAERALTEFANVHIQTLDSYCGGIVRQAANRYGIRPDFSSGTADSKSIVKNLALPYILKNKNNPGVLYYSDAAKLQDFAENEFAFIISKNTTLATPENYFIECLKKQCHEIVRAWNENVTFARKLLNQIEAVFEQNKIELMSKQFHEKGILIEKLLAIEIPEFNTFSNENCIFLQNENETKSIFSVIEYIKNWKELKISGNTKNQTLLTIKSYAEALIKEKLPVLQSLGGFVKDFPYTKELCLLLDDFLEQVKSLKRTSGALEFSDVTEMALKVLVEQKDIRRQEKEAFNKIMIDEFQDNNGKNRDLLFLLSEAGEEADLVFDGNNPEGLHQALKNRIVKDKLFFVGDEKQSIYKFRGADVSVFNELKNDLAAINGPDSFLQMIYNYRSDPELLTSFNTMFGGHVIVDGEYEDKKLPSVFLHDSDNGFEALYPYSGIARYVDKSTHEELAPVVLNQSNVKTHVEYFFQKSDFDLLAEKNEVLSKDNQIPYAIAKKISELHKLKNVPYSSIAILDRGRGSRKYLLPWLERFDIPYNLDQQAELFADGPVNDIYSFLRLCVYPSDLKAFCAFMCSPFAGLSESQIEQIVAFNMEVKNHDYVFKAFEKNIEEQLSGFYGKDSIVLERYVKAKTFFLENQSKILSQPITESLNFLWYECGYHYETMLNRSVSIFEEQYDLLFELGRNVDDQGKGVAWFIDELALQKANEHAAFSSSDTELNTKEVSYPVERENAIKIMTIHKSKGLQFDYVFALGCLSPGKSETSSSFYFDEEYGVTFKTEDGSGNYFFNRIKEISAEKDEAELRRVIYVAATRAVKELYLFGKMELTQNGDFSSKYTNMVTSIISCFYPDFFTADKQYDFTPDAPFDICQIPVVPSSVYDDFSKTMPIDELRAKKIKDAEKWINSCNVITTPVLESNRISPSSLELEYDEKLTAELKKSQNDLIDLYAELDKVIEKNTGRFDFADFGTLVHFYLEETINDQDSSAILEHAVKLFKKLDKKDINQLNEICLKICAAFMETEAGQKVHFAKENKLKVKAEHGFKSFKDGKIITGSIDLYFENVDGSFTIIDYKTDHVINPDVYKEQQLCYKDAVCNLYNLPENKVDCKLYYIRFNLFADVG